MTPQRITLSRAKGWRMPENTVKVDRSTKWGNPFIVGQHGTSDACVTRFRDLLTGLISMFPVPCPSYLDQAYARDLIIANLHTLRGKNLACWCKPGQPCHADVLLELANSGGGV